jgi:DNA-binding MarR family transcriptional regulator
MGRRQVRLAVDPIAEAVRNWQERGWGSPAHLAAALSLGRAEDIAGSAARAVLEPLGLTMSRHEMLMLLYFSVHGELPLGKMGDRLMVHATSVTNTVDALERQGLITRVPHPTDRRTTRARITDAGREMAERSAATLAADTFGIGVLDEEEAAQLVALLRKLRLGAGDFIESEPVDAD